MELSHIVLIDFRLDIEIFFLKIEKDTKTRFKTIDVRPLLFFILFPAPSAFLGDGVSGYFW